jgi:hypothetical protein
MKTPTHRTLATLAGSTLLLAACGASGPQTPAASAAASACTTRAQAFAVPGVRITEAEPVPGDTANFSCRNP